MEFRYVTRVKPEVVTRVLEEIGYTPVRGSNKPSKKFTLTREPRNQLTLIREEIEYYNRGLNMVIRTYRATVYTMRGDPMEPEEYFTVIRTDDPKIEREVMGKRIGNYIKCDDNFVFDDKIDKLTRKWLDI
jgi:hypothetical protein